MPDPLSFSSIPFNKPHLAGRELDNIVEAVSKGHLAGDGTYTKRVNRLLAERLKAAGVLLTHSATAALEMFALLLDVEPGDEIIMPSFTFVSTANAFVLRGGVPVFVDIRPDTLNIDESAIEGAITSRTKGIVPVHYAGVSCAMDEIMSIASRRGLWVAEDAAQALGSSYRGRALGTIGSLGALSFHETKNIISGEGGALIVNDPALLERAEIIREKGTDRSKFLRGAVDKYTWVDVGSSYLPSEIVAAFLSAQLDECERLQHERSTLWSAYHAALEPLERHGVLRRPVIPEGAAHNAHLYYVLLDSAATRNAVIDAMRGNGIGAIFHYIPLHSSPAGRRFARAHGSMEVTDDLSSRLLRLPLFNGLGFERVDRVVDLLTSTLAVA